ncbi:MAG: hypothetical protein ABI681_04540 [Gemmatimonadales bacterium]
MTRHAWTFALACGLIAPLQSQAQAQHTDDEIELLRFMGTPIGALPPIALPMPASRNHSYWSGRLQTGYRKAPDGSALPAVAGGVDFQYRGGSLFGVVAGWQKRDCGPLDSSCGGHALFGARALINLMTGGSAMAGLLRDNSTTSTLGTKIGIGYAPNVVSGVNACTIDFGLPFSVAKRRQRPRLAAYVTPGVAWDFSCGSGGPSSRKSYLTDFGFGLQQVGNRSLDIYFGMQKVFRSRAGLQAGISFTYVRLP